MSTAQKIHDALLAADIEYGAVSWDGFNLFGDAKSIAKLHRLMAEASQADELLQRLRTTLHLRKCERENSQ